MEWGVYHLALLSIGGVMCMHRLFDFSKVISLRAIYNTVERLMVIIIPALYILLQFLSIWIPAIEDYISDTGYLLIISQSLIFMFLHFDFMTKSEVNIIRTDRIIRDIERTLDKKNHYKEIKILASTGYQYIRAFKESGVIVEHLRILLRKYDDINAIRLPSASDEDKLRFQRSAQELVKQWHELQETKQIKQLEISFYDFDTTVHFMIIEERRLFWGFLYPKKEYPGSGVLATYSVNNKSDTGDQMIADFIQEWNHVFDCSTK